MGCQHHTRCSQYGFYEAFGSLVNAVMLGTTNFFFEEVMVVVGVVLVVSSFWGGLFCWCEEKRKKVLAQIGRHLQGHRILVMRMVDLEGTRQVYVPRHVQDDASQHPGVLVIGHHDSRGPGPHQQIHA